MRYFKIPENIRKYLTPPEIRIVADRKKGTAILTFPDCERTECECKRGWKGVDLYRLKELAGATCPVTIGCTTFRGHELVQVRILARKVVDYMTRAD